MDGKIQLKTIVIFVFLIGGIVYLHSQFKDWKDNHAAIESQLQALRNYVKHIQAGQLYKMERNINLLKKYSKRMKLRFSKMQSFAKNYWIDQRTNTIHKITNQKAILYQLRPIQSSGIYYFDAKIVKSFYSDLSIGVFTHKKLSNNFNCGYCQSDELYYIHAQDGEIYHGSAWIGTKSQKSRVPKIAQGDTLTLFIDKQHSQLSYYLNNRYISSQKLSSSKEQQLYVFFISSTKGDQIAILK